MGERDRREPSERAADSTTTMSGPTDDSKTFLGHGYSASQLLYAATRKLRETVVSGRCVQSRSYCV